MSKYIEKNLASHLEKLYKQVKYSNPILLKEIKVFINANKSGKRLRAFLINLGYELVSGKSNKEIWNIASAYEIFHTSILIHDDVIDQSPTRRSQKSVYHQLGANHQGESLAICLGDMGFFLSYKIISETSFPIEKKDQAIGFFSKIIFNTALGEMVDVKLSDNLKKITQTDLLNLATLKTAQYSISGPLILGAILAGAKQKFLNELESFGNNLGIAYQVKDDILGVFGDPKKLGKSNLSDVEEGKSTFLYLFAYQNSNSPQKSFLDKYYGKGRISSGNFNRLKQIFSETKALEKAQTIVEHFANQAKNNIEKITNNKKNQLILKSLAEDLINREN